jgi:hypothetical protein
MLLRGITNGSSEKQREPSTKKAKGVGTASNESRHHSRNINRRNSNCKENPNQSKKLIWVTSYNYIMDLLEN